MEKVINIKPGDLIIARGEETRIQSLPIGATVFILIYDPSQKVAGIIQPIIPAESPYKKSIKPLFRPESAIDLLIDNLKGSKINPSQTHAYIVGGGQFLTSPFSSQDQTEENIKRIEELLKAKDISEITTHLDNYSSSSVSFDLGSGSLSLIHPRKRQF